MSINGDLLVHKKLWVIMVRELSHHLTIRLQNLPYGTLQEFQTMYAWNISVIFKDLAALLENK